MRLSGGCVELDLQSIEGAKHEAQLGARMAVLDLDNPLAADADAAGDGRGCGGADAPGVAPDSDEEPFVPPQLR